MLRSDVLATTVPAARRAEGAEGAKATCAGAVTGADVGAAATREEADTACCPAPGACATESGIFLSSAAEESTGTMFAGVLLEGVPRVPLATPLTEAEGVVPGVADVAMMGVST